MGLDVVELTLRCEEEFDVALENDRLERVRTVGDLFEPSEGWSRDSVWFKLVQIIIEQLQVDEADVTYHASFLDDLGAD
jgi:acyl carrier protein